MSYHPNVYGDANGVTKTSIQLTSRPGAWENFVASGNLRTQDVYDSEEGIRARYAAAVAAAGEHDIVTLTAQTDGTTTVIYNEETDDVAVAPVAGDGGTTSQVRGVLLDMSIVFLPPTSYAVLAGDMTGTWRWYSLPSPELTSPLSLISEEVGTEDGIFTPGLPSEGWVLLTKGSGSILGDIMAGSYPSAAMSYVLPSAEGFGTRSLLTTSGLSNFAPVLRSSGIGGNTIALHELRVVSVPIPAAVAGQQLLTLTIPMLDHSSACTITARDAQGAALATTAGTIANGVLSTALTLPSAAVELRIALATPWVGTVRIGFSPVSASSSTLGYLGIGTSSSLYRWADAQSLTWTYRDPLGTPVPCYTGTITTTTYTRDPNNLVPAQAGIYDVDYSTSVETHNPQEDWTDIQRAAWSAVIAGQRLFTYAGRTYNAWATCPANPFSNYPDQERRVGLCTVTWADKVDNPKEEPPSSTHSGYTHYRGGGQKRLTGYAETWYLHTASYADR